MSAKGREIGESVSALAAGCETVNSRPPATIVPVLGGPGFASALKLTVPSPDPLDPAVTRSQPSFDAAVQVQPSGVLTSKVPEPPPASTTTAAGLSTYKHGAPS